jgi:hypothetical protein
MLGYKSEMMSHSEGASRCLHLRDLSKTCLGVPTGGLLVSRKHNNVKNIAVEDG